MKLILNIVAFQISWFACVLGAANGMPWLGPVVVLLVLGLHLWLVPAPARELMLAGCALLFGLVFDSILVTAGWLSYEHGMVLSTLAPYWIVAMWVGFATTLNVSMRWMHGRPGLAIIMGAVGGPMAFWGGARLGAVTINDPLQGYLALAVVWAVAMPLLSTLSQRFDGTVQAPKVPAGSGAAAEQ